MQTSKRWLNAKRVGESTEKDLKIVSFRQPKWLKSCVCWCRRSIFSSSSILITIKAFLNITHKKWTRKHHHNTISFSSYVPSHRMNFFFSFFSFLFFPFRFDFANRLLIETHTCTRAQRWVSRDTRIEIFQPPTTNAWRWNVDLNSSLCWSLWAIDENRSDLN